MTKKHQLAIVLGLLIFPLVKCFSEDEKVPSPLAYIRSEIIEDKDFAPSPLLSITMINAEGWHTYWKNPGDAGLPIKFEFSKGEEQNIHALNNPPMEKEWPTPKRMIEQGDIWAYGYNGSNTFFFDLKNETLSELEGKNFINKITFLICKHICVPGEITVQGQVSGGKYLARNSAVEIDRSTLLSRFQELPQNSDEAYKLDLILAKDSENKLILYYNIDANESAGPVYLNLLTPFPLLPFSFKREELFKDSEGHLYGKMAIDFDGEYQEPQIPFPVDGKFQTPYLLKFLFPKKMGQTLVVEKTFDRFDLEASKKLESFYKNLTLIKPVGANQAEAENPTVVPPHETEQSKLSFFMAILLGLIGGLILNVMPCVLPVISLKLFSLAKIHAENPKAIMKHNFFYTLGILITFFALAITIVILKNLGHEVGWGFQLQSPTFIFIMIIILTVMALNFFGLYELSTPGQTLLNFKIKEGPANDIFSGFLATILSTPCSAPFLGSALTYAFTQNALNTVAVFLSIGVGLSLPFMLTGLVPSLISFLPKPGEWMNHLKKYLGLTLLLTVIWLLDVFVALTTDYGNLPLLQVLTLLLFITFTLMMNKTQKTLIPKVIHGSFVVLFAVWILVTLGKNPVNPEEDALIAEKNLKDLKWERWNEEKMKSLQAEGQIVFVDFTAKWCFTCKANEKLVIETDGFKEIVSKYNVKLLLADWTKRDELIGSFLKAQGLSGVPAYFVINKNKELISLGETLSLSRIEGAINGESLNEGQQK